MGDAGRTGRIRRTAVEQSQETLKGVFKSPPATANQVLRSRPWGKYGIHRGPPLTANKVLRQGFWVYEFASGGFAYNNLGVVGKNVAAAFAFYCRTKIGRRDDTL